MTEKPRNYDKEFTTPLDHRVRRRIGYSHVHGEIIRFVVQLEYYVKDDWTEVVRLDHDSKSEVAHDVTEEGIHVDIYRDSEKIRPEKIFPPMPPSEALTFVEDHLAQQAQRYIKRFEKWHGSRKR